MPKAIFLVPAEESLKPNLRARREAQALRDAGWDYEMNSVTLLPAPKKGLLSRAIWFRHYTRSLARMPLTADPKPDIIVAHDVYTLPAGRIAANELNVPLIYDSHEHWPALIGEHSRLEALLSEWIEKSPYGRKPDHVFVPSEAIAGRFRKMGLPTTVLYNARSERDIGGVNREKARELFGYDDSDFVVGYIGAMEHLMKGEMFETLFDAVHRIPRAKLLIVGGPDKDANDLRSYVKTVGLSDRVYIDEQHPFDSLPPFYAVLDVGIISLDERPNHIVALPNKLFDYMAYGVPVVAPDYPDISRVISLHECGVTFPDETYLYGVLSVASERLSSLEQMGERGRKAFLETYAWEHQAKKVVRVCESYTSGT